MPSLFIVVDEFSEMLTAKPDFIDLFVAIGRLGRSIGVHLLLASQRLEEGRLRGLESHLSYRLGLRTFSARSRARCSASPTPTSCRRSRAGLPQARPVDVQRFKAAYVSGPPSGRTPVRRDEGGHVRGILPFTISEVQTLETPEPEPVVVAPTPSADDQDSLLDIAVQHMQGQGPAAHQVWLPPLDRPDTLDQLMSDLAVDPEHAGLGQWRRLGGLIVPLGTVDRPREQRRDTLTVDLNGAGGHAASSAVPAAARAPCCAPWCQHGADDHPRESQFFVLDFGGGLAAVSSFQGMLSAVPFLTIGHLDVARFDYQSRPASAKFSSKFRR